LEWTAYNDVFYSIDASRVYDTAMPPSGAHGDVRSRDKVSCEDAWDESSNDLSAEKREYTANFVYVFTKKLEACYSLPPETISNDLKSKRNQGFCSYL
jgi:hypothetical protein